MDSRSLFSDRVTYGDIISLQKKECVTHVEKRKGTRLKNVKKYNMGIDCKGTGKMTDKVINDLTKYYGLVIWRHSNSVPEI